MKKKELTYIKPEVEIIEIQMENTLMQASVRIVEDDYHSGAAGSKRRDFWGE